MKSTLSIHWKDWCWSSSTLATWWKELTHWKRPRCWERWRAEGAWGDRWWDDWMTSLTQWTWVWVNKLWESLSELSLGDSEGQGSLASCRLWCLKDSDTTERLNNKRVNLQSSYHRDLLVVKTLSFHQGGAGSIDSPGTIAPYAMCVWSRSVVSDSLRPHGR